MTSQVTGANSSVTSARRCGDVFTLSNPLGPQVCRITSDSLSASTRRAVMQAHSACVGDSLVCECNRMVVYCCCCRWPSERASERTSRSSVASSHIQERTRAGLALLAELTGGRVLAQHALHSLYVELGSLSGMALNTRNKRNVITLISWLYNYATLYRTTVIEHNMHDKRIFIRNDHIYKNRFMYMCKWPSCHSPQTGVETRWGQVVRAAGKLFP